VKCPSCRNEMYEIEPGVFKCRECYATVRNDEEAKVEPPPAGKSVFDQLVEGVSKALRAEKELVEDKKSDIDKELS